MAAEVKIKPGATIYQDHTFGMRWPQCHAPDGGNEADDPDTIFAIEDNRPFHKEGWLDLVAFGFGDLESKNGYGSGSISVREDDVIYITGQPAFLGANI